MLRQLNPTCMVIQWQRCGLSHKGFLTAGNLLRVCHYRATSTCDSLITGTSQCYSIKPDQDWEGIGIQHVPKIPPSRITLQLTVSFCPSSALPHLIPCPLPYNLLTCGLPALAGIYGLTRAQEVV